MSISNINKNLQQALGKKGAVEAFIQQQERLLALEKKLLTATQEAQLILQESAKLTQEQLQYHISHLITLAMEAVFDEPYNIQLEFDSVRGKTGAYLFFEREGEIVNPLDAAGGGAVDVASLGGQISLWTLQKPRTRAVLVLDEPLKWLKGGDLPDKGAAMLKQISELLGIQIIMVSHSPELIEHADKVFTITKRNNISSIKEI